MASDQARENEILDHMGKMEGNELEGYIPSDGSGVTVGMGVDLLHQNRSKLQQMGIPENIIKKLEPYFGKSKADVTKAGLKPKDLKLTKDEVTTLNKPFVKDQIKTAIEYGKKMTVKGSACLASLRHWAGSLGHTDGKLAPPVNGSNTNYVWSAIKDKNATDKDLLGALEKTFENYWTTRPKNKGTIEREIKYLKGLPY